MRKLSWGFVTAALLAAAGCSSDEPNGVPAATNHIFYELEIDGRTVVLDLRPNDTVVAPSYREYVVSPDGLAEQARAAPPRNCMYRGGARWADGRISTGLAWSALNNCTGFSGMVAIDGETWVLSPGRARDEVFISRLSQGGGASARTVTIRESSRRLAATPSSEQEGELAQALNPPSKYLELVVVSDAARFKELGLKAPSDALQLANLADALYRNGTLTPSIAIVVTANIVIRGAKDPWPVAATGEVDSSTLLTGFTSWAKTRLPPGDGYVLLSQRDFDGSKIGLGSLSSTCTSNAAVIVQATSTQALVSTALSHELGHNLGMGHDSANNYVMSASLGAPPATTWSAQSSTQLAGYLAQLGPNDCLNNVPQPDLGARCGDGVQDAGEQCDCGSKDCTGFDPCCNGATCQLLPGAQCSELDGCCKLCQLVPKGTVCEPATPCTPASVCSGKSSKCSAPAPYENGTVCAIATFEDGRCLQGECVSRDQQCNEFKAGDVACPVGMSPVATSCQSLSCMPSGGGGCITWVSTGGALVLEGSSCGDGLQCYQGSCVASTSLSRCDNELPVNACGGCETLASAPGVACNKCGVTECFSGGVVCSVTSPGQCREWVTGAFGPCSATCGSGVQTRSVTCQNGFGTVLADASCEALGPKPSTDQPCNLTPCITYEWLTGAFGACTVECGSGTASRSVTCVESGTTTVVADSLCAAPKPDVSTPCDEVCLSGFECLAGACSAIDACEGAPCETGEVCRSTGPGTYACDSIGNGGATGDGGATGEGGARDSGAAGAAPGASGETNAGGADGVGGGGGDSVSAGGTSRGGTTSLGGRTAGAGGDPDAAPTGTANQGSPSDDGCSCRTGPRPGGAAGMLVGCAALALAGARRRRSRGERETPRTSTR